MEDFRKLDILMENGKREWHGMDEICHRSLEAFFFSKVCHTCTNQCTSRIWCLRCYHRQSPRDFTPCARRLLFFLTPGLYWTLRYLKLSWKTVQEVTVFLPCKWLGTYWGDGTRSLGSIGWCYSALLRSVVTKELMILFAFCALAATGAQKPLHQVNKLLRSHCDKSLSLVTCTDMIPGILRLYVVVL